MTIEVHFNKSFAKGKGSTIFARAMKDDPTSRHKVRGHY